MGKKVKMKTRKTMAKRIKVTGSGKLMHRSSGRGHNTAKKGKRRLRRLRQEKLVSKAMEKHVRRSLGL
ncbi:MAG: large subunit ribosomal protein [Thermotogota bacterium]|nr:large subunit ribosomal protein [Thermotogota bacterium]MDK2864808.1 large subunit ribosomal protein [Thermotogota bacterium]HCZ06448.1 50S ribosomal protein L35 [Thermotogota bacterium]